MNSRHGVDTTPTRKLIDLATLAALLQQKLEGKAPRGYLRGKTRMRDTLQDALDISAVRAEQLVDQLHARGFVRYSGNPKLVERRPREWAIHVNPNTAR